MKKENILIGKVDDKVIKEWKDKYTAGIYQLIVEDKGEEHVAYFRNPDIDDLNLAAGCATKEKPLDYFKALIAETKIGGSEEVTKRTPLFLSLIETMKEKIDGKKGTILDL